MTDEDKQEIQQAMQLMATAFFSELESVNASFAAIHARLIALESWAEMLCAERAGKKISIN